MIDQYIIQRVLLIGDLFIKFQDTDDLDMVENITQIFIEIMTVNEDQNKNFYDSLRDEISATYHLDIIFLKMGNGGSQEEYFCASMLN